MMISNSHLVTLAQNPVLTTQDTTRSMAVELLHYRSLFGERYIAWALMEYLGVPEQRRWASPFVVRTEDRIIQIDLCPDQPGQHILKLVTTPYYPTDTFIGAIGPNSYLNLLKCPSMTVLVPNRIWTGNVTIFLSQLMEFLTHRGEALRDAVRAIVYSSGYISEGIPREWRTRIQDREAINRLIRQTFPEDLNMMLENRRLTFAALGISTEENPNLLTCAFDIPQWRV